MLRMGALWLILLTQSLVFFLVWKQYYATDIRIPFFYKGHWAIALFYLFVLTVMTISLGGYKIGYQTKWQLTYSHILASIFSGIFAYLQIVLLSARFVNWYPIALKIGIDIVVIIILIFLADILFMKLFPPRRLLLLYDEYEPTDLLNKIKKNYRLKIDMALQIKDEEHIYQEIDRSEGVILYDLHSADRNVFLKYCYKVGVRTYTTTKVSDIIMRGSEYLDIFDTPLLLSRNQGLNFEQKLIKRTIDIICSAIILIVSSPILLITAIAIKLEDRGPVFFKQDRITEGNREFEILKFRSMIVHDDKNTDMPVTLDKDPRITKVGHIIRKYRIDELPQMINILKGDMSLVGPRPERIENVVEYTNLIPEFPFRHKVKGGLTGMAQIYGKANTRPYDKLQLDLMYIQNYSVINDIKLMLLTIRVLFEKESTEGFAQENVIKGDK